MAKQFSVTKIANKFETVSVLHQTIARRVDHIKYVSKKQHYTVEKCNYFSLCLDESTDLSDISQLVIFLRTIQNDFSVADEMMKPELWYGTEIGFAGFLKQNNINCPVIPTLIHQEALCGKSLR
ncbi:hypothetical protein JTB14_000885 [Gonioctena quinquepunctata]|nr:hypothetical protein JTB14_000885 [Gonioctena quinquepunctata]